MEDFGSGNVRDLDAARMQPRRLDKRGKRPESGLHRSASSSTLARIAKPAEIACSQFGGVRHCASVWSYQRATIRLTTLQLIWMSSKLPIWASGLASVQRMTSSRAPGCAMQCPSVIISHGVRARALPAFTKSGKLRSGTGSNSSFGPSSGSIAAACARSASANTAITR